jgi:hypothetical protein
MKKEQNFENLEQLLEKIKTIGFFERIFSWGQIRNLSYDAYEELKSIDKELDSAIKESAVKFEHEKIELQSEIKQLHNKDKENIKKIAEYESIKEREQNDYSKKIDQLNKLQEQIDKDRIRLQKERDDEKERYFEEMKNTWKVHEQNVEDKLKLICNQRHLEYFSKDKVEIKGKPDNTIKIGEQYIIFDAKAPAEKDKLANFPGYIRDQAKKLDKYINEKDVRKSIYLVVPHNTIGVIKETTINISNYKVFVISVESLEPIIESLQEILQYKYVDQLSPEQREKIAEIIGRFAHSTKRKIEVDNWMNKNFLEILDTCNDLDENTKNRSIDLEKSYVLNPEMDKKGRLIDINKLDEDIKVIDHKRVLKDKKLFKSDKK